MKTVIQIRIEEDLKAKWQKSAGDQSLTEYIIQRVESPIIPQGSHVEIVPPVFPGELEQIIAEKDAEIARLRSELDDMRFSVPPKKSPPIQSLDLVPSGKSPQVIAREQGLKNATGGLQGHKANCSCGMCAELRGKK